MQELLKLFAEMDAAAQVSIIGIVVLGIVKLGRALGLQTAPGIVSVLTAAGVGALTGLVANGWQGALLGLLAGLAATGGHQVVKQMQKFPRDMLSGEDAWRGL